MSKHWFVECLEKAGYIRMDNKREKLVGGKVVLVLEENITPYWPDNIMALASAIRDGKDCLGEIHDELKKVGLYKTAAHFVPGHCDGYECALAYIITKGRNPDWGNTHWFFNKEEDRIKCLEMQQELEDYWRDR